MEIHLLPHIILEEKTGLILRPYIAIGLFRRSQTPFASPRVYWSSSELELVEKTAAPCHKEFAPHNGDGVHRVPLHHGPRDGPDPTLFFSRRAITIFYSKTVEESSRDQVLQFNRHKCLIIVKSEPRHNAGFQTKTKSRFMISNSSTLIKSEKEAMLLIGTDLKNRRLFGKSGIFNRENLAEYKRAFEADEAKVTYCKSFKPPKYISCVC
ncbi:hypothetical protein MJT46_002346 [Ovis ammon polii x Ovis aries]|nr:hypothetical protein MJT46_002346 [Ovis ammon polii x Ovis aries]